ncbi:hypothetical protein BX600DRAFT_432218 [Xylariales sp. PMI_506]|nr:hypothetical protein BX600DRAFT_432218 [Xylariales sp. PMI_506]
MIVSTPRLNLRRAASYTGFQNEKLPLSATSSSFNFNHLLFSPPPSPGLPVLVARPRKPSNAPRPSKVIRTFVWSAMLFAFLYITRILVRKNGGGAASIVGWDMPLPVDYEMVGQYELPDFPTPIAVTDNRGRSKWTVSIPPTYNFPLTAQEYSDICAKCQEVATHVREIRGTSHSQQVQPNYYYQDPYFVDVHEAVDHGLLPGVNSKIWHARAKSEHGHLVGKAADWTGKDSCKTTMTFVLESQDAGLGPTLMMLWMAYGLAQKENRAFFIDDSRWAYGEYTDIFKAPPVPNCKPPPRHEMLPCPHHARHLVVSTATTRENFGSSFDAAYAQLGKEDIDRERPMYDLARVGYEALFHLNEDDQSYVNDRIRELRVKAKVSQEHHKDGTIIGVHVRHGDRHPFEFEYSGTYMPLTVYTETVAQIIDDHYNASTPEGGDDNIAKKHSLTVLASDDPDVFQASEFSGSIPAQDRIRLASVSHPAEENQNPRVMHKFVEKTFGWEGGFFASMFWNLGRPSGVNPRTDLSSLPPPSAETTQLRSMIGRSYMMDLAVLGQGTDTVVCTISATGCRLIGVIMGWEKAMVQGNWVNIDGNYQWTGVSL